MNQSTIASGCRVLPGSNNQHTQKIMNNPFKKKTSRAKNIDKIKNSIGILYLAFWACWIACNFIGELIRNKKAAAAATATA